MKPILSQASKVDFSLARGVLPEDRRQSVVTTLLENLPRTLEGCVAQACTGRSNLPILDVSDATLVRLGSLRLSLLSLSGGKFWAPNGKGDLNSAAYETLWKALEDRGLHPFLTTESKRGTQGAKPTSVISLSRDEVETFLKQETDSYIFKAIDFIRESGSNDASLRPPSNERLQAISAECLQRFPLLATELEKAGVTSSSRFYDLVSATNAFYTSSTKISGPEAHVVLRYRDNKTKESKAIATSNPLISGFQDLAEVRAAFDLIKWPTNGNQRHASHDPRNPILIQKNCSGQSYYSLSIDCRTFQDENHLASTARLINRELAALGGLKEMTPIQIGRGLVIVPYNQSSIFGLKDIHCAVFASMERAENFAKKYEFYDSGKISGDPKSKSGSAQ